MKIAVITAMREEFTAVSRCLESGTSAQLDGFRILRSRIAGHTVTAIESGMGFVNATRAAKMLAREEKPDLLISAGFCGALAPQLQTGDIVVARQLLFAAENGFEEIPVALSGAGEAFIASQGGAVGGTFVSTSAIASKKRLASMLPSCYPNPVAEMESGAIAAVAAEHSIPLLAIRAVSDIAAEELGFSLDEFCDPDMRRILPHKVLLTALRKPRIIPQLLRLAAGSRQAAQALTAALTCLFPALEDATRR